MCWRWEVSLISSFLEFSCAYYLFKRKWDGLDARFAYFMVAIGCMESLQGLIWYFALYKEEGNIKDNNTNLNTSDSDSESVYGINTNADSSQQKLFNNQILSFLVVLSAWIQIPYAMVRFIPDRFEELERRQKRLSTLQQPENGQNLNTIQSLDNMTVVIPSVASESSDMGNTVNSQSVNNNVDTNLSLVNLSEDKVSWTRNGKMQTYFFCQYLFVLFCQYLTGIWVTTKGEFGHQIWPCAASLAVFWKKYYGQIDIFPNQHRNSQTQGYTNEEVLRERFLGQQYKNSYNGTIINHDHDSESNMISSTVLNGCVLTCLGYIGVIAYSLLPLLTFSVIPNSMNSNQSQSQSHQSHQSQSSTLRLLPLRRPSIIDKIFNSTPSHPGSSALEFFGFCIIGITGFSITFFGHLGKSLEACSVWCWSAGLYGVFFTIRPWLRSVVFNLGKTDIGEVRYRSHESLINSTSSLSTVTSSLNSHKVPGESEGNSTLNKNNRGQNPGVTGVGNRLSSN